jgi:hypothetical protein
VNSLPNTASATLERPLDGPHLARLGVRRSPAFARAWRTCVSSSKRRLEREAVHERWYGAGDVLECIAVKASSSSRRSADFSRGVRLSGHNRITGERSSHTRSAL